MKLKRIAYKLHLWLGLVSGLIVFVVCLTGAIWAFAINGWVNTSDAPTLQLEGNRSFSFLFPSQIAKLAEKDLSSSVLSYVDYKMAEPVEVGVYSDAYSRTVWLNPYDGKTLLVKDKGVGKEDEQAFDFWHFIAAGHRSLWLPWEVGRPVVNYGTLLFVLVLLTGLVIWIPKSGKAFKQRLRFHWNSNTSVRRKIFDLHGVLGFYVTSILLIVAFTGMVWGIEWWSKATYKLTTGGKDLVEWSVAKSDTLQKASTFTIEEGVDRVFQKLITAYPHAYRIRINYPDIAVASSCIEATVYPDKNTYYNSDSYAFDRYSLKLIALNDPYHTKYAEARFGDKLRRMNYEIHTGAIAGTPGKLLVFFAALIGASLPVTGLYLYLKKNRKKRRKG